MIDNNNYENVLHVLTNKLNTASKKNDRDIANKLLIFFEVIPNLSIEELAHSCYTSQSTLTRYIQKLGYENYNEFKMYVNNFKKVLKEEINSDLLNTNADNIISQTINNNITSLNTTKEQLDLQSIIKATKLIHECKDIVIIGIDYSQIVALDAQLRFMRFNKIMKTAIINSNQLKLVDELTEDSLVIFLSVSGDTKGLINIAKQCPNNINSILITSNKESMIAKNLTNCTPLIIDDEHSTFTNSALNGRVNLLAVIDILYINYGIKYWH